LEKFADADVIGNPEEPRMGAFEVTTEVRFLSLSLSFTSLIHVGMSTYVHMYHVDIMVQDGRLLYSKMTTRKFPTPDEIRAAL
jgi:hypothetical protein